MSSEAGRIIDLYQRRALEWVRDRERPGGMMEKSWLDRFRALVPRVGSILDIGCGSAVPISRYLIEAGHSVTGVDSSATLIDFCRDRFPAHEWIVADIARSRLDGHSMASSHGTVSSTCVRKTNGRCFRFFGSMPRPVLP